MCESISACLAQSITQTMVRSAARCVWGNPHCSLGTCSCTLTVSWVLHPLHDNGYSWIRWPTLHLQYTALYCTLLSLGAAHAIRQQVRSSTPDYILETCELLLLLYCYCTQVQFTYLVRGLQYNILCDFLCAGFYVPWRGPHDAIADLPGRVRHLSLPQGNLLQQLQVFASYLLCPCLDLL
jgi:hypothetical protein